MQQTSAEVSDSWVLGMSEKKRLPQETCWLVDEKRCLWVDWRDSGCELFDSSRQQEGWTGFSRTVAMWEWDDLLWMEAELKYSLCLLLCFPSFVSWFEVFLYSPLRLQWICFSILNDEIRNKTELIWSVHLLSKHYTLPGMKIICPKFQIWQFKFRMSFILYQSNYIGQ